MSSLNGKGTSQIHLYILTTLPATGKTKINFYLRRGSCTKINVCRTNIWKTRINFLEGALEGDPHACCISVLSLFPLL